jgi:hypothetical protein
VTPRFKLFDSADLSEVCCLSSFHGISANPSAAP